METTVQDPKAILTRYFGDSVKPVDNGYRINIKYLINDGLKGLLLLDQDHNIEVKRSGPGISILLTKKEEVSHG